MQFFVSMLGMKALPSNSHYGSIAVIPAGMPESSAMDGNSPLCKCLIQYTHQPADSPPCDWIPAVHAGMTGFNHLCITTRAGAWQRAGGGRLQQAATATAPPPDDGTAGRREPAWRFPKGRVFPAAAWGTTRRGPPTICRCPRGRPRQ